MPWSIAHWMATQTSCGHSSSKLLPWVKVLSLPFQLAHQDWLLPALMPGVHSVPLTCMSSVCQTHTRSDSLIIVWMGNFHRKLPIQAIQQLCACMLQESSISQIVPHHVMPHHVLTLYSQHMPPVSTLQTAQQISLCRNQMQMEDISQR